MAKFRVEIVESIEVDSKGLGREDEDGFYRELMDRFVRELSDKLWDGVPLSCEVTRLDPNGRPMKWAVGKDAEGRPHRYPVSEETS